VGCVLFQDSTEGTDSFSDLGEGITSMLVLLTTANYPDVMMPAYTSNRAWSLYFIMYLIVGLFFMLNLVLATVCDSFREMLNEHEMQRMSQRAASLNASFRMLRRVDIVSTTTTTTTQIAEEKVDNEETKSTHEKEVISLATYSALQHELERKGLTLFSDEQDKILSNKAEDLKLTYPNLSSKPIDRQRFEHLLETSMVIRTHHKNLRARYRDVDPWEFDTVIRQLWSCMCGENLYNFIVRWIEHVSVLTLLDILSLANVILIYMSDKWQENTQRAIASIYVAHILILILFGGMKNFLSRKSNLFDLVVSTMQFVTALSVTSEEYETHDRFVRVILLLRLFRGFRILFRVERYKVVFDSFTSLLVDAGELLGMMLAIFLL
jgi:two pore calcium channel protein, plant